MTAIKAESRVYFKALGAHVGLLRKARGMTQVELARAIGVSQQAVFAYELGDRRVSVFILFKLSKVLNIPVEDLMGMARPARLPKRRLSPRTMRHAERLQALSKTQQRFVIRIIDLLEGTPHDRRSLLAAIDQPTVLTQAPVLAAGALFAAGRREFTSKKNPTVYFLPLKSDQPNTSRCTSGRRLGDR